MKLEIRPEPDSDERAAIEAALRTLLVGRALPAAYSSAWRRAGIAENVASD